MTVTWTKRSLLSSAANEITGSTGPARGRRIRLGLSRKDAGPSFRLNRVAYVAISIQARAKVMMIAMLIVTPLVLILRNTRIVLSHCERVSTG